MVIVHHFWLGSPLAVIIFKKSHISKYFLTAGLFISGAGANLTFRYNDLNLTFSSVLNRFLAHGLPHIIMRFCFWKSYFYWNIMDMDRLEWNIRYFFVISWPLWFIITTTHTADKEWVFPKLSTFQALCIFALLLNICIIIDLPLKSAQFLDVMAFFIFVFCLISKHILRCSCFLFSVYIHLFSRD